MSSPNINLAKRAKADVDALIEAREAARLQTHQFAADIWRSWRDLEQEIDVKLEDAEQRLAQGGAFVSETVSARARELRAAIDALLRQHASPTVGPIMTAAVRTCTPEDTLEHAARILWEADCGAVPVVDGSGKLVGMLTDRDICMAAYTRDAKLSSCSVGSTMSPVVHACRASDRLEDVANLMAEHRVRRIPITEPDGSLIGIVSICDVAQYLSSLPDEHAARALLLPTFAAITAPRAP